MNLSGLFAYPSHTLAIGNTIKTALEELARCGVAEGLKSWEENDIPGRFIAEAVLKNIDKGNIFVADITYPNFNVAFEIGYAIARKKRSFLVRNRALKGGEKTVGGGLFDTLGYETYTSSQDLASLLKAISSLDALPFNTDAINRRAPVYILFPRIRTDFEILLLSRIKKARLKFRNFDPEEQGRLPAGEAIDQTAESLGVVVNLLPSLREGSEEHNLRAAFVAGLAIGMGKAILILQEGDDPVPLDYRDLARSVYQLHHLNDFVANFSTEIAEALQETELETGAVPTSFLARLSLGASAAENEIPELGFYYIETDEYQRALRGEVRIVAGRKGSGKTALFYRVRDQLLKHRKKVVLDLKPEGFQFLRFRERVLDFMEEGTKEHTITAFWEYILLLEIAYRLLRSDHTLHMRDGNLYTPYLNLEKLFREGESLSEGDFAERMLQITNRISDEFREKYGTSEKGLRLEPNQITHLLYRHDIPKLKNQVSEYLALKDELWVLVDNIDKGWPAHGVTEADVLTLRALINAMAQLERHFQKRRIEAHGLVFVRNDVFELMVASTADRGKLSQVTLDWQDSALLREMLRRRFIYSGVSSNLSFEEIWPRIAVTHLGGEETSQYLIDRSLMRPRALLELVGLCKSHAVNLGHERIENDDILNGERIFSGKIFDDISYELADIHPESGDVLYSFIEAPIILTGHQILERLEGRTMDSQDLFNLLLWYSVFGVRLDSERLAYIYDVNYDLRRMKELINNRGGKDATFQIHPAFWVALDVNGA